MGWVGGVTKVANTVSETAFKAAKKQKQFLINRGTDYLKGAYTLFDKDPIDTGESQDNTTLQIINRKNSILFRAKIDTEQATFFTRGLGSNRKYGRRNVLKAGMAVFLRNVFEADLKTGETIQEGIAGKNTKLKKPKKVTYNIKLK